MGKMIACCKTHPEKPSETASIPPLDLFLSAIFKYFLKLRTFKFHHLHYPFQIFFPTAGCGFYFSSCFPSPNPPVLSLFGGVPGCRSTFSPTYQSAPTDSIRSCGSFAAIAVSKSSWSSLYAVRHPEMWLCRDM